MPRFFTLQQAERTLPHVEAAVRGAIGLKTEYQQREAAIREFSHKVMMSGGMSVDRESVARMHEARDHAAARLQEAIQEIHNFGCQVKDLDIGLLDFPSLYQGREVCLCWRLGESRIEFWHGVDEGFQGRKPIDAEFLQNHSGDPVS